MASPLLFPMGLASVDRVPSRSQLEAIEAEAGPLLVLAGPGSGKTYCLTERIRFLIERHGVDPNRICAFTFTNKAAGEIAQRLSERLGTVAEQITRGTIHAFCATLLREHGTRVGVEPGFGIADEEYQLGVLRRVEGYRRWHAATLKRFSVYRIRGDGLFHDDLALLQKYERFLADRNVVDFDSLVSKAAELLHTTEGAAIRGLWDVVLVDEFQDLNPIQYRVIQSLSLDHRHVFAVGDPEQSIYSWAGADSKVFEAFMGDHRLPGAIQLEENWRCDRGVFGLARTLVERNPSILGDRITPRSERTSPFQVRAYEFGTDDDEAAWIIEDIRRDHEENGLRWGDVALLYKAHWIGERLEVDLVNAGIPCRLAKRRALSDDPVVSYVMAAVRVIARPDDDVARDQLLRTMIPRGLYDEAVTKATASRHDLRQQLNQMIAELPRADAQRRRIRLALMTWKNLVAVGKQHPTLTALVQELLSRRVVGLQSVLDENHDSITDPAEDANVVRLARRLQLARDRRVPIWLPPMGGAEIALKGMLNELGFTAIQLGGEPASEAQQILDGDLHPLGLPLGLFKAVQLLEMGDSAAAFTSFTAIDLETTSNDAEVAEIVEIAAVRVRGGMIVDQYSSLVRPNCSISQAAADVHGIGDAEVRDAPAFEEVWPAMRAFCGDDVVVAHNGYDFDFRVLARMARAAGGRFDLCTYDTLPLARDLSPKSRRLPDLARQFGIPPGKSHRALDDTLTLARVFLALGRLKLAHARKTALVDLLGHLGVALALCEEGTLGEEALLFRDITRVYALGKYTGCLEWYEREHANYPSTPTTNDVVAQLGGAKLMARVRAQKSADQRYPAAMARLRRLMVKIPEGPLESQLAIFLERAALSRAEGDQGESTRVNLFTLHSTKGLEFSRVYLVGVEDAQLPGGSPKTGPTADEVEEARRVLYVGMTRTIDRLVMTRAATRGGNQTGGHRFLDEMGLVPEKAGQLTT